MALLVSKHPCSALIAAHYRFLSVDLLGHVFSADRTTLKALKHPKSFSFRITIKPYKIGVG
jgi:hypothetical protein